MSTSLICENRTRIFLRIFLIGWIGILSLAMTQEEVVTVNISSDEADTFKVLIPDGEWGKPIYLYSKTGIPYRCYLRPSEGMPLSCRRTAEGEETLEALGAKNK